MVYGYVFFRIPCYIPFDCYHRSQSLGSFFEGIQTCHECILFHFFFSSSLNATAQYGNVRRLVLKRFFQLCTYTRTFYCTVLSILRTLGSYELLVCMYMWIQNIASPLRKGMCIFGQSKSNFECSANTLTRKFYTSSVTRIFITRQTKNNEEKKFYQTEWQTHLIIFLTIAFWHFIVGTWDLVEFYDNIV